MIAPFAMVEKLFEGALIGALTLAYAFAVGGLMHLWDAQGVALYILTATCVGFIAALGLFGASAYNLRQRFSAS
jgi:hypothetical protein